MEIKLINVDSIFYEKLEKRNKDNEI